MNTLTQAPPGAGQAQQAARTAKHEGRRPTVSVVVPALNEAANLPHVFAALPPRLHQVVLVDGGSVDDTVAVARDLLPTVEIVQQTRRGKGNALACGFEACTGDIIVMIDADGSTDPGEIPAYVAALTNGADFAKGTRFADGGRSLDITPIRRLGNLGLNGFVNALFRTRFSDLCYGYNAFWRDLLPVLDLPATDLPPRADGKKRWGDGFEIETLINVRVARSVRRGIAEVPSVERERIHGESNLNAVRDGLRVLRTILSERFSGGPKHTIVRNRPMHAVVWTPDPDARPSTAAAKVLDTDTVEVDKAS